MAGIEGARPNADEARAYGILIVDDEEAILESLELTLGIEYRVFTATSAEAGLEILDREDIALVISDQGDARDERRRVPREGDRAQSARHADDADRLRGHALADRRDQRRAHRRYIPKFWELDDLRSR